MSERKRFDLLTPAVGSFGLECDDDDGHLVAYVRFVAAPAPARAWTMELVVHPHWEGRVEAEVLAVATVMVLQRGGGGLTWWTDNPAHHQIAAPWGFVTARRLEQWRRPLDGIIGHPPPRGITFRHFDGSPQDRKVLLEVNNRAFAGHPEQGGWSEADLSSRLAAGWFDPRKLFLAEHAEHTIGFCWLKWKQREREAELYAIAVDPDRAVAGLGRALATTALAAMSAEQRGAVATLYVDAANERACALYRSLGFRPHRAQHALHLEVPDVPALALRPPAPVMAPSEIAVIGAGTPHEHRRPTGARQAHEKPESSRTP